MWVKRIEKCKESEISCLHLLGSFDLAHRKTFVITVTWEDKEMNYHYFDFLYYFSLKNIYIFGHVFFVFCFLLLYRIAHFLWASTFSPALFKFELSILEVFMIFITKEVHIPVNLVPFLNDVLFLFCRFLKSGVTNELKSIFLWKSKKVRVIYSKQCKTLLLIKR